MPPKTDKEVVFFLVNGGRQPENGANDFFEKGKEAMSQIITKKTFLRPKDEVGIMVGAAHADINEDDDNDNCVLLQRNQVPTWEMVEKVKKLERSELRFCNWHLALSKTINFIQRSVHAAARIVLILLLDCDDTYAVPRSVNAQQYANRITSLEIHLMWIGSKPLNGIPFERLNNSEKILMEIVEVAMGDYRQINKVLPQLRLYKRPTATYRAWKCILELGNINIPTATYVQSTDDMKKPPFKNVSVKAEARNDNSTHSQDDANDFTIGLPHEKSEIPRVNPDDLEYVKSEREYVDRHKEAHDVADTIPGYMYGRHFVPVAEADEVGMKYDGGPKSFKIYGFVPREAIQLEDLNSDSTRIVLPEGSLSTKPFFCLVQAMMDADRVAIVRRVYSAATDPKMGVLIPRLDVPGEPWCMVLVDLLFAEDRRLIKSRPLNSAMRNLTTEKENIVGDMIDAMMLTDCTDDEDREVFAPGTVPTPNLQHLWNSMSFRALHPNEPIPPMCDYLKKLIEPPESIKMKQEPLLPRLRDMFPIEDELVLLKKESETPDEVAVPVLSEVIKMESDLKKMESDDDKMETNTVEKGSKRKRSFDVIATQEELTEEPDLDDLFDGDMS